MSALNRKALRRSLGRGQSRLGRGEGAASAITRPTRGRQCHPTTRPRSRCSRWAQFVDLNWAGSQTEYAYAILRPSAFRPWRGCGPAPRAVRGSPTLLSATTVVNNSCCQQHVLSTTACRQQGAICPASVALGADHGLIAVSHEGSSRAAVAPAASALFEDRNTARASRHARAMPLRGPAKTL